MGEMEAQAAAAPSSSSSSVNPRAESICEECKSKASKYKCPGCSLRSCSLPCVNSHKQRTGCSGKRPQSQFLPLSQINDHVILSDYNMLEDVKRVADSAQRTRVKLCGENSHFRLPFHLKNLQRAASKRSTKLMFLSTGMSKRETNRTCYNYRKKTISWTVEWRFHSTDITLTDHGVQENSSLGSLIANHLKPGPWSHQLKQFCLEPLESLKFFIRKYPKGPKSPFCELDIRASIREQLANLVIVEYPVIHVFLPSQSYGFEVIKKTIPHKPELNESVSNREPTNTKGVFFREEVIEDDNLSDPHVLDIMKLAKPYGISEASHQATLMEKKTSNTPDGPRLSREGEGSIPVRKDAGCFGIAEDDDYHLHSNKEMGAFENEDEDADIDCEPDDYSDPTKANQGQLFDSEGMFPDGMMPKDRKDQIDVGGNCEEDEELEEGEIPGF